MEIFDKHLLFLLLVLFPRPPLPWPAAAIRGGYIGISPRVNVRKYYVHDEETHVVTNFCKLL